MRTNVTIDSQLIHAVQHAVGVKTKAKAVVIALSDYLRWHRIAKIKGYRGKVRFRNDTVSYRRHDR
ncbi:MAG: type II toxin-antitoxin system VapB family antitoxin [Deltaproteobacteria bacterium]|nr:type II toxin-antitoxin system VapB family antitoxin [Deltaproteobacteria bacterium]